MRLLRGREPKCLRRKAARLAVTARAAPELRRPQRLGKGGGGEPEMSKFGVDVHARAAVKRYDIDTLSCILLKASCGLVE